jgi:hypothetical protein
VEKLKGTANITSMYRLYCVFRTLQFDVFGYYAMGSTDNSTTYASMAMIRIDPTSNSLRCDQILSDGIVGRGDMNEYWRIIYDESSWSLRLMSRPSSSRFQFTTDIRCIDNDKSFHGQLLGKLVLRPLPPLINMLDQKCAVRRSATDVADHMTVLRHSHPLGLQLHPCLAQCVGLFTAIYGPHGSEILHLSVEEAVGGDAGNPPRLKLKALKVTGDRNVPAGNHSFVIDLSHSLDFAEEMLRDTRPVAVMSPAQPNASVLLNFTERRPSIAKWYRGKGQINRIPGVWEPEWVDCSLIIHDELLPSTGARCTVVWDDAGSLHWRHAMDINPLVVRDAGAS